MHSGLHVRVWLGGCAHGLCWQPGGGGGGGQGSCVVHRATCVGYQLVGVWVGGGGFGRVKMRFRAGDEVVRTCCCITAHPHHNILWAPSDPPPPTLYPDQVLSEYVPSSPTNNSKIKGGEDTRGHIMGYAGVCVCLGRQHGLRLAPRLQSIGPTPLLLSHTHAPSPVSPHGHLPSLYCSPATGHVPPLLLSHTRTPSSVIAHTHVPVLPSLYCSPHT